MGFQRDGRMTVRFIAFLLVVSPAALHQKKPVLIGRDEIKFFPHRRKRSHELSSASVRPTAGNGTDELTHYSGDSETMSAKVLSVDVPILRVTSDPS
jgi:hypothetical protein